MQKVAEPFLRRSAFPTFFCPGCGCGTVLNSTVRAVAELGGPQNMLWVGGIGCSSWVPVFLQADAIKTLHGRAIAFAFGLKLAQPERKVVVFTGDGDCMGIGGNHLIHACRRNVDMVVVMMNNSVYAMTGGQVAPTTPLGMDTTTSPYGNLEPPFDACELAKAAGATHVERWTSAHPRHLTLALQRAIAHRGFSFIEVLSLCPIFTGRSVLGTDDPVESYRWLRKLTSKKEGAVTVGRLYGPDTSRPEYAAQIWALGRERSLP